MNRRAFLAQTGAAAALGTLPSLTQAAPAPSPLADHRIKTILFKNVDLPWPRQVGRNATRGIHGRGPSPLICLLGTEDGPVGWGQIQGNRKSVEDIRDQLIGNSVHELIDPASGIQRPALRPVDIPLHDLAANLLGLPVWKMMGSADDYEPAVVYSGMIYFDDLDPAEKPAGIDVVLENCRWDYEYGYRQFKVKIGRGNKWMPPAKGLRRDIDVVRAIHDAFPDVEILVDGNNGFTLESFLQFMKGIEGIPLFWIEEPFHETVADWTKLKEWLVANGREKTFRADGEAQPDYAVLEELQKDKTLNLRLDDVCGMGFTDWRRFMPKLIKEGIAASPHTWGTALKTVYAAHLAAAYGNAPTIEGVTTKGGKDVGFGENKIVDARFQVSSKPGFGLTLLEK